MAHNPQQVQTPPGPMLPPAVVGDLAARVGPLGLFLLAVRGDGSVVAHDVSAATFFTRYALPLVQSAPARQACPAAGTGTAPGAPPSQVRELPEGLLVAEVSLGRPQRQGGAALLVVARSDRFHLGEEALAACSRLGLDAEWLEGQARLVPGFGHDALAARRKLVALMARDQLRLAGLEQQVDSLSTQLANTYEELSLLYRTSGGMKVDRRPREFFEQVCRNLLDVVQVRGMGAVLPPGPSGPTVGAGGDEAVFHGPLRLPPEILRRLRADLPPALARAAGPLQVADTAADPRWAWLAPHARQVLAVPMQRQDHVLGCLFALDKVDGEFDSADAKLVHSIANEAAIYLENARLFGDVHGLMMGLVHSLTSAVDAKDPYTCGHSERVALLSRHLAREAGLSPYDVEQIYLAGLLHDVGKIGVPEAVLQKAGRLTAEEFEQIKKHPAIGARILQDIAQVRHIVPGVLHHHERYDGKGYPNGLAGASIPLMGRIICLADSLDAMTSNRTYRRALPLEVALGEIRRCSGTHFDPRLAETFLRTGAEAFRDLLNDHHEKARKVLSVEAA